MPYTAVVDGDVQRGLTSVALQTTEQMKVQEARESSIELNRLDIASVWIEGGKSRMLLLV